MDYLYDAIGTTGRGIVQAIGFISARPLIAGSLFIAIVGAIMGTRIAQMQAMRRRKNIFERSMDTLGSFIPFVTGMMIRRPKGPIDTLRETGRDVATATRGLSSTVMGGMPMVGRPQPEVTRRVESTTEQVGNALSLIPITLALIRNPLVRDLGFRFMARRLARR